MAAHNWHDRCPRCPVCRKHRHGGDCTPDTAYGSDRETDERLDQESRDQRAW